MNQLAERRLEERERRRVEILDAAEAFAAEIGVETMTMDQVAKKARLSRALLYVYFQDKAALTLGICQRALQQLGDRFESAVAEQLHGHDQVVACGRAYVAFALEHPVRFATLAGFESRLPADQPNSAYSDCMSAGDRSHSVLVRAIARGIADGSIDRDAGDPLLIGFTLWGLMHGIIQLTMVKRGELERRGIATEALIEHAFALATRAIATPLRDRS